MKKLFTLTLFLLGLLPTLMAQTAEPTGSAPEAGKTYYLYNVEKGSYLSAGSDGTLTLGSPYLAVTLAKASSTTTADADYYTLSADGKKVLAALHQTPVLGEDKQNYYDQWKFSAVSGKTNVYNVGCRNRAVGAMMNMYWSNLFNRLYTVLVNIGTILENGQWKLVSTDDVATEEITLDETATEYTATAISNTATVHLKRTLTQNCWNSFCVPFDIDAAQLKEQFGENVKVAEFTGLDATTIKFTSVSSVEAGKPYLLYTEAEAPAAGYYTFIGVTSLLSSPTVVTQSIDGTSVSFNASFCQTTAPAKAYVLRNDQVYCLTSEMTMKGFRGYFAESTSGSAASNITEWSLDGQTTGITDIDAGNAAKHDVFNVAGQKVKTNTDNTDGLPQGVYIVNGKKTTK